MIAELPRLFFVGTGENGGYRSDGKNVVSQRLLGGIQEKSRVHSAGKGHCDLRVLVEKILKETTAKIILVEIHAEATSEKLAMGYMLDGRVSALWGTHTHVPTADAMVLPKGTGYVTDLGMTGPLHSVLGIQPHLSIAKFRGDLTNRYQWADGPTKMEAVLFTIDSATGRCITAERVDIKE